MKGLMQDVPLTLPFVFRRAAREGRTREVVTAPDRRATWGEVTDRALQIGRAFRSLGLERGDRVGTFGWNSQRHLELFLAAPCFGYVIHAVNVRLHESQVAWMVGHADDRVLFVDASLTPLLEPIRARLRGVRAFVVMDDGAEPADAFAGDPRYEELLAGEPAELDFPQLEESDAAVVCYTSGTTGNPKGVVYSQRSVVLHTMQQLMVDGHHISAQDTVLPVTALFHVVAWGLPYSTALATGKLVLASGQTAPEQVLALMEREAVTVVAAVPTVLTRLAELLDSGAFQAPSLRRILCGGAHLSEALVARFEARGIDVKCAWGMTEMSPSGTMTRQGEAAPHGYAVPGVEMRIVDDAGAELPWDGESVGEIEVRGPWIARAYYEPEDDSNEARFHDGWLRSGDLASIAPDGGLRLVDRVKDLVKSGGEWISSVELEARLSQHPDVLEVAVVARPDPEWDERPIAFVVVRKGASVTGDQLVEYLRPQVAKWWIPDAFELVPDLPKTTVGKIDKRELRRLAAGDGAG
jgi:fatty-acyl-CoA synthase